jgi:nucleotide-binding universal stress UspA family protein
MTFKTIVVHCNGDKAIQQRLAVATDLATRFESYLVGLHVRPPFQPPVYFDGSFVMDDLYKIHEDTQAAEQKAALAAFAAATEGRNIAVEREIVDGLVDREVTKRARCADLTVLGQTGSDMPAATLPDLPEVVALAAGRPVLVIPYIPVRRPIGKNIILCWNASRESARAAADALPFLKGADKVTVLSFRADGEDMGAHAAVKWLGRHGVKASAVEESLGSVDVGDLVLSRASDLGADMIVMGVYGHTRVREMVLGGMSRTLLRSMTVPVFMAH